MYLLLANGDRVLVHKENCAFEKLENRPGVYVHRDWDRTPYYYLSQGFEGFFVIAKYESRSDDPCEMIISTKHVVAIADAEKWEFEDVNRDVVERIEATRNALF